MPTVAYQRLACHVFSVSAIYLPSGYPGPGRLDRGTGLLAKLLCSQSLDNSGTMTTMIRKGLGGSVEDWTGRDG